MIQEINLNGIGVSPSLCFIAALGSPFISRGMGGAGKLLSREFQNGLTDIILLCMSNTWIQLQMYSLQVIGQGTDG
jgi:hypothetical protein